MPVKDGIFPEQESRNVARYSSGCLGFGYDHTTGEAWRTLSFMGYHGYSVRTDGTVWTIKIGRRVRKAGSPLYASRWKQMDLRYDRHGYARVQLWRGGQPAEVFNHALVLEAFVGRCPPGMQCRHLNGKQKDNRPDNLLWGTAKENAADKVRHGRVNGGGRIRCRGCGRYERATATCCACWHVPGTSTNGVDGKNSALQGKPECP